MAVIRPTSSVACSDDFSKEKDQKSSSHRISKLFENKQVAAACSLTNHTFRTDRLPLEGLGAAAGILLSNAAETTGITTAVHEVIGHGFLGYQMTENYSAGNGPHYVIQGWENLKAIGNAGSFKDALIAFFQWIGGDCHGSDFAGMTFSGQTSGPNAMGQAMGPDGMAAWISLSGSLPMLAIDTASVVGGMLLRRRSPVIGSMLIGAGLSDAAINSYYPISAATMSSQEMQQQPSHDFANFAVHMSSILGVSAETVAIATAAIWTSIVPLAALFAYLYAASNAANTVPDALAVKRWLQKAAADPKAAKQLEELYQKFPWKDEFAEICQRVLSDPTLLSGEEIEKAQRYALAFIAYVLDNLPASTVNEEKREILAEWEKSVSPNRLQTALSASSVLGGSVAIATKVMGYFATTIAPSLTPVVTVLTYASPVFMGVSVLSTGYQLYKDFKCPDSSVPKSAKMLSVARLITSIVCAVLITTALFMPGLNFLFIGAVTIGSVIHILLAYARSRIIRKQFALTQALKPEIASVMAELWLQHQKKPAGTKMHPALQLWVDTVKQDRNFKFPIELQSVNT